ncbi:MAG: hypothetical protein GY781_15195 [Gammaproteobacteria bacterium]|nr:hypothetical protein [Gammaproteobacteria bacterium]
MRKTVKQLEAEIQKLEGLLDIGGDKVSELETKVKSAENGNNYAVKQQSELRAEINSLHHVFNAMAFDEPVETGTYTSPPNITIRFAIYQNHLLVKSMKPKKVKK